MYGWRQRVEAIKRDTIAVYFAARDKRTPWGAKVFAGLVVSYVLSPIDLIPDFIPVLGYLDDLILVPIGLWGAISMIPDEVMVECRARRDARCAARQPARGGSNHVGLDCGDGGSRMDTLSQSAPLGALSLWKERRGIMTSQRSPACLGGHRASPNEQNTQQSPAFGFRTAPHPRQS